MTTSRLTKSKLKALINLEHGGSIDKLKTARMFQLEREYQVSIVELLDGTVSGRVLGQRYKLTEGCISRWRKRFGIVPVHKNCYYCNGEFASSSKVCPYCGKVQ